MNTKYNFYVFLLLFFFESASGGKNIGKVFGIVGKIPIIASNSRLQLMKKIINQTKNNENILQEYEKNFSSKYGSLKKNNFIKHGLHFKKISGSNIRLEEISNNFFDSNHNMDRYNAIWSKGEDFLDKHNYHGAIFLQPKGSDIQYIHNVPYYRLGVLRIANKYQEYGLGKYVMWETLARQYITQDIKNFYIGAVYPMFYKQFGFKYFNDVSNQMLLSENDLKQTLKQYASSGGIIIEDPESMPYFIQLLNLLKIPYSIQEPLKTIDTIKSEIQSINNLEDMENFLKEHKSLFKKIEQNDLRAILKIFSEEFDPKIYKTNSFKNIFEKIIEISYRTELTIDDIEFILRFIHTVNTTEEFVNFFKKNELLLTKIFGGKNLSGVAYEMMHLFGDNADISKKLNKLAESFIDNKAMFSVNKFLSFWNRA